jgi:hypothetical protein
MGIDFSGFRNRVLDNRLFKLEFSETEMHHASDVNAHLKGGFSLNKKVVLQVFARLI